MHTHTDAQTQNVDRTSVERVFSVASLAWSGMGAVLVLAVVVMLPALAVSVVQGLTLVHFSAQLKRILWDRGAFRGCFGGVWEVSGVIKEDQGGVQGVF